MIVGKRERFFPSPCWCYKESITRCFLVARGLNQLEGDNEATPTAGKTLVRVGRSDRMCIFVEFLPNQGVHKDLEGSRRSGQSCSFLTHLEHRHQVAFRLSQPPALNSLDQLESQTLLTRGVRAFA